jgi:hypothetical protein
MKRMLLTLTVIIFSAGMALANDAYDKGLLAGKRSMAWPDEVGLLTKRELTYRAEDQADYAMRDDLITAGDYDEFVAGWMDGVLSLYPNTFSALIAGLTDADLKRLLIGTWTAGVEPEFMDEPPPRATLTFTSDGRWLDGNSGDEEARWDIREGKLIAIMPSVLTEFGPSPEKELNYTIITLTRHKCVIQENGHGNHFATWTRR